MSTYPPNISNPIYGAYTQKSAQAADLEGRLSLIGTINVMDPAYGAVGNNTANDAPAIQAAITAASNAGGGTVILPAAAGYSLGSTGITVPSNVHLVCLAGIQIFTYTGTGIALDALGAANSSISNAYVICTNDAGSGVRWGGSAGNASRWCMMSNVTAQGSGTATNNGAAFILDSGPAFCAYLFGQQVYGLGFKYGLKMVGQSFGANTWTTVNFDQLSLVGRSAGIIPGSIGIWTDSNTNNEGSTIRGVVIEGFENPYQFDSGGFGFSVSGGIEGNTNVEGVFPYTYAGEVYDPHSDGYYRRGSSNGVSNRWDAEKRYAGEWTSESFFDRIHALYDGNTTRVAWGVRRGGSPINGEAVVDKFVVYTGASNDKSSNTNYQKFLDFKQSYDTAAPTGGAWSVGSEVKNSVPAVGQPKGWLCTAAGTLKTALSGVTGSITSGTALLTVNSISTMVVDDFIAIVGVTGTKRIVSISGLVLTLDSNASATVAGAAVSYPAPSFVSTGNL